MKQSRAVSPTASRRESYWRLIWAVVLLLHMPITLKAFGNILGPEEGRTSWSSILLLTLSNVFFLLEIWFAYSLRLLSDRRRLVAFIVIIALLHVGVLARGLPQSIPGSELHYWVFAATVGIALIRNLHQIGMACWREAFEHALEHRRQIARWWYFLRTAPNRAPAPAQAVWRFTPPRAPPTLF